MLIPTSTLRAVAIAMAKKDFRHYINGMLIETANSTARLVATDGHRMHLADVDLPEPVAAVSAIIPRSLIDWAIKQAGRKVTVVDIVVIPSPPDEEGAPTMPHITMTVAGATMTERAIDGRYPDYSRVVPHEASGEPAQYNPRYVLDAYTACAEYLQKTRPEQEHATALRMNGRAAAVMAVGKFAAIVMPWRAVEIDIDPCLLRPVGMLPEPDGVPTCSLADADTLDPDGALRAAGMLVVIGDTAPAVPLPAGWEAEQASVDYANARMRVVAP